MARNFQKSLMQSEFDGSKLTTGVFCSNYTDENTHTLSECPDGAIVEIVDLMKSDLYGFKDPNVYAIKAPSADNVEVAVVDYVGVSEGKIMNVNYREGTKLYGLEVPEGRQTRVRRLCKHDTAYWSKDCFVGAAAAGKFAVPTVGDTKWTIVEAIDTTKTCIKLHFERAVTEGTVDKDTEFFCEVVNVI